MKGLFEMIKSILFMKNSNSSNLAKKAYGKKSTLKDASTHSMLGHRSYGKSKVLKWRKRNERNGFKIDNAKHIKKDK